MAVPLKVFINYRHEDLQGTVWAIYGKLVQHFGPENVFFDSGTLRPGMQCFEEIKSHVAGAGVFLSLIGSAWMPSLVRRMQEGGDDYVAEEIDLAFQGAPSVRVIPVLVGDGAPPDPELLPPALRPLSGCQVKRLRYTDLLDDLDVLIDDLDAPGEVPVQPRDTPGKEPLPNGTEVVDPATATEIDPAEQSDGAGGANHRQPAGVSADPTERRRQMAPTPDDDHYGTIVEEAENLVVFLGAGVNADDHDGSWPNASGSVPDDAELARYLADKIRLTSGRFDLAEVAQYARTLRGEPNVYKWVRQVFNAPTPGPVQQYLAQFPKRLHNLGLGKRYQMIVTPKYDAALERALTKAREPFDVAVFMGPGTDQAGSFLHLPWGGPPKLINEPNDYLGFPITEDGEVLRTVVVRINGAADDREAGYRWKDNFVITEDHYIDYLSSRTPEDLIPSQILAKLRDASCLFLGYTISDWRLRVFLKRIWTGERIGRGRCWAVERAPDMLERQLWLGAGVQLYESRLTDYIDQLDRFLVAHVSQPPA